MGSGPAPTRPGGLAASATISRLGAKLTASARPFARNCLLVRGKRNNEKTATPDLTLRADSGATNPRRGTSYVDKFPLRDPKRRSSVGGARQVRHRLQVGIPGDQGRSPQALREGQESAVEHFHSN